VDLIEKDRIRDTFRRHATMSTYGVVYAA